MKRSSWLCFGVSVTMVLVMSLATRAHAEVDESDTTSTGKQRIVQIATAELPPKEEKEMQRYLLASMPGDTVAVLFMDNDLYAMTRDGILEQVEGGHGSRAFASVDRTAFAVCRTVREEPDEESEVPSLWVEARTFDSSLRRVSTIRVSPRLRRTILSNDGTTVIGISPITEHTGSAITSWFHRENCPPIVVARGHGGVARVAKLSSDGALFVIWGSPRGMIAYDQDGNELWSMAMSIEDMASSLQILETAGRIAFIRTKHPLKHDGTSLVLLDLQGNVICNPDPAFEYGDLFTDPEGKYLIRWAGGGALRRIDPANGHELWRVEPERLGNADHIRVTTKAILIFDWQTMVVRAIRFDGEISTSWAYPGEGEPWGFISSSACSERFVTVRGNRIYACELRSD